MPTNFVVMHINGEPWTLGGLCLAASPVLFVASMVVLFWASSHWGTSRALSASEAAQVAFNAGESSSVDRAVTAFGPAKGKEWRMDYSASTLREAWHARDYIKFFGLPAMSVLGTSAFELAVFGAHLLAGPDSFILLFVLPNIALVPMYLVVFFLMWAAIFTNLE